MKVLKPVIIKLWIGKGRAGVGGRGSEGAEGLKLALWDPSPGPQLRDIFVRSAYMSSAIP